MSLRTAPRFLPLPWRLQLRERLSKLRGSVAGDPMLGPMAAEGSGAYLALENGSGARPGSRSGVVLPPIASGAYEGEPATATE